MLKTIGSVSQKVRQSKGLRISNIGTKYGVCGEAMTIKLGSGSGPGTKWLDPKSSNGPGQASQSHGTWIERLDGMTHSILPTDARGSGFR